MPTKTGNDDEMQDQVEHTLQTLQQECEGLFDALEKSEKWATIRPEVAAAVDAIEEGVVFSPTDIFQRLKDKVAEEDLLNLHGFLASQMAWMYLKTICEKWPEQGPFMIDFARVVTAAGAAWQRHYGSIPVKKAFAELVPLANRGEKNLRTTTEAGLNSHGLRESERTDRDEAFQQEINRLCDPPRRMSYQGALKSIVEKGMTIKGHTHKLSFGHLKRITKNPKS